MLNLFTLVAGSKKQQENNQIKNVPYFTENHYTKPSKHFPSPIREWKNSIYVYNKNGLNLLPSTTSSINNIIKSYFNLYNKKMEVKMRTKRLLLRLRRLSSNKYYISTGGFKHTNNKVLINLYVFNRQKTNYLLTLKKWYLKTFLKNNKDVNLFSSNNGEANKKRINRNINIRLIKRLKLINKKGIQAVKKLNKDKYLLIKAINCVLKNNNYNINTFKKLSKYTENFYKNLIKKSLKKIRMYFYYRQLLYINKSKLNYTYLQYLKKHLENFYNKNVEFNLINTKRFYLNSDILSESISVKLTRNRRRMFKYLTKLRNKIDLKKKDLMVMPTSEKQVNKQTLNVYKNFSQNRFLLQKFIVDNLKYKYVTGFRLEAKGRLSKRYTASRSVYKLRYKGNLLNTDSSYKGLSSVILKGNLKSNIQYTKLKSKSRIGSFGIKGWVSGN